MLLRTGKLYVVQSQGKYFSREMTKGPTEPCPIGMIVLVLKYDITIAGWQALSQFGAIYISDFGLVPANGWVTK